MILINGIHEYDYVTESNVHILKYANSEGKVAMQIIDDGNGYKVNLEEYGRLDYEEAEQLLILLKLIDKESDYEIVTKTEKI